MRLIRIGYWAGDGGRWPDVHDFVDANWAKDDQVDCMLYLRRGLLAHAYFGPSVCRLCGKLNGSVELTDFVYIWPEGLEHYLAEHAVRLPDEFVRHVREQARLMDDVEVDDSWWLEQRYRSPS